MKPNFKTMPRAELRAYVLEHREDLEAFQTLINRRSPDSEATWYDFPDTEEGQKQIKEAIKRRIEKNI